MTTSATNNDLVENFLANAERLYGPRFVGISFEVQETGPRGPLHTDFNPSTNHAIIRIPSGLSDLDRAGQLAQETIHVLSPATPDEATVFDRGLATFFAVGECQYCPPRERRNYLDALEAVSRFNDMCPTAIRCLRSVQPRVALIKEEDIVRACNRLGRETAHFLVRRSY